MKLINNMTDLSNKEIGIVLDKLSKYIDTIYKCIDTIYYDKIEVAEFTKNDRNFKVQIHYLKRYTRFDIWEEK